MIPVYTWSPRGLTQETRRKQGGSCALVPSRAATFSFSVSCRFPLRYHRPIRWRRSPQERFRFSKGKGTVARFRPKEVARQVTETVSTGVVSNKKFRADRGQDVFAGSTNYTNRMRSPSPGRQQTEDACISSLRDVHISSSLDALPRSTVEASFTVPS